MAFQVSWSSIIPHGSNFQTALICWYCLQGRVPAWKWCSQPHSSAREGHVQRTEAIPVHQLRSEVEWDLHEPGESQPSKIHWSQTSNTMTALWVAGGKKNHWQESLVYKDLGKGSLLKQRLRETQNLRSRIE